MRKKGVIFDLDGTLWNPTRLVLSAWNDAFAICGAPEASLTGESLSGIIGKSVDEIALNALPAEKKHLKDDIVTLYRENRAKNDPIPLYPGAKAALKNLFETYRLFIVNNGQLSYIKHFFAQHGVEKYFEDYESWSRTGLDKAQNISLVMGRNSVKSAVYVGDTQKDLDAAKEAEVLFVYARYGMGKIDEDALYIKNLSELAPLLRRIF